ncbi:MAG: amidohydrolase family protein [bacterium]|nr:amidohydrolase family protein [bacterium]
MTRDKRGKNSPFINVDGVKIYMDGVPKDGEGGAPMIDACATAPTFGTPSIDEATFSTWMLRFDRDNVPEPNPRLGLAGMITRRYPGHPEYGQWKMDERIDVETAIQIFTRNGAVAREREDETGTIEVGKSADFIVINQNLLEIPPQNIHKTKVLRTVLKGHAVYEGK